MNIKNISKKPSEVALTFSSICAMCFALFYLNPDLGKIFFYLSIGFILAAFFITIKNSLYLLHNKLV